MTGDEDDTFDMDLDMPAQAVAPALSERDEIVAENAPASSEITDVDFHELDLP
jgi:hypothetical protein